MKRSALFLLISVASLRGQEAESGFDLRGTVSGLAVSSPHFGRSVDGGFRAVFYPVWKLNEHWTVSGAYQVNSRPYFYEDLATKGRGLDSNVLQATVNYSRSWGKTLMSIRAGQLSTAFGSFPQRYDDADNPLIDHPSDYGYYSAVSVLSVAGAQMDVTHGNFDARVQLANSSPANPRNVFARDQYGNWAGGAGYTIRQGFRVGVSGYRGPYLSRDFEYFFPGEANPNTLPARAIGIDVEWARGHWNVQGEWHKFVLPYHAIPDFHEQTGYVEIKRVLNPRWYLAVRTGYVNAFGTRQNLETVAAFRPNRNQVIKVGYELDRVSHTLAVQVVTTVHPLSLATR